MDEDDDDESDVKNASSESGGMCNVDIGAANRTRNSNKINLTSQQSTYKLRDSRFVNIILLYCLKKLNIYIVYIVQTTFNDTILFVIIF